MPINNDLIPKKSPMPIRFNEKPTTEFKNALESIKVTLVQSLLSGNSSCIHDFFGKIF